MRAKRRLGLFVVALLWTPAPISVPRDAAPPDVGQVTASFAIPLSQALIGGAVVADGSPVHVYRR